jgi:hypothetical protein
MRTQRLSATATFPVWKASSMQERQVIDRSDRARARAELLNGKCAHDLGTGSRNPLLPARMRRRRGLGAISGGYTLERGYAVLDPRVVRFDLPGEPFA